MRTTLLALVMCTVVGGSVRAAEPATWFIVEGGLGYGMGEAFAEAPTGITTGVTLGFGGKPKGWPLRFYGIVNLGWGSYDGQVESDVDRSTIERSTFSYSAGLRILAPIYRRLRFLSEVTIGGFAVASEASLANGAERVVADDGSFLVGFAAGLQWRFNLWFSLGARIELQIPTGLDAFDPIAESAGAPSSDAGVSNVGFGLTATFHL